MVSFEQHAVEGINNNMTVKLVAVVVYNSMTIAFIQYDRKDSINRHKLHFHTLPDGAPYFSHSRVPWDSFYDMEAQFRLSIQAVDVFVAVNMCIPHPNTILHVVSDLTERQTPDELNKFNSAYVLRVFWISTDIVPISVNFFCPCSQFTSYGGSLNASTASSLGMSKMVTIVEQMLR